MKFCGLNQIIQVQHPVLNLFHSPELKPLQQTLDGRLKELQALQRPIKKKGHPVSVSNERQMWNSGILGTSCPNSVINTLLYLTRKLFGLQGGKEQRELTHDRFELVEKPDGMVVVKYTEKISKTNQGGLKRRKQEVKQMKHVENPLHKESFSFIYSFYISMWYVFVSFCTVTACFTKY